MISAAAYIFGGQWIGQLGRDRLMRGFGVLGLGEFVVRVSRIVTAIVLARYLTAAELGIAATAIACFELCRVLANNGIGQAVIRVSQERLAATCNTAYRLAWIVCGVSAAVQVSATASQTMRMTRRFQRSASVPLQGISSSAGRVANKVNWLKSRTEPVRWNSHTPSAKPVRCVPIIETNWPSQIR